MKELVLKYALINALDHEGKADVGAVLGKILAEDPELKKRIKEIVPEIEKIVKQINTWSRGKQESQLKKFKYKKIEKVQRIGLFPLPNAEMGKVVLRLAPFPSGALHIGNAKTYMLNAIYSEMYKGKLIFVMDDTIGSEEKIIVSEAYDLIPEGFKWLGVKWVEPIIYKSDRLELYYKYSKELIKKDSAYVCECSPESLRENRAKGIECSHRKRSAEENGRLFDDMLSRKFKEGEAILRLKTSMQHPNPAFRDRVLCRISERNHPRVGDKYKVWPMLELSWAIDDHLLGITHVIRGNDLMIESDMCKFIWDILGWKYPTLIHTGLVHIEGIKISKSKAQKEIMSGEYSGWDDPRTWSLQSLRKRGIQPKAIRNFIIGMGLSPVDSSVPVEILYAENRKIIDSEANRYFVIFNPMEISIKNAPKINKVKIPLHPDFPKRGDRTITPDFSKIYVEKEDFEKLNGQEVGLINLFSVRLGNETEFLSKKIKMESKKIQWLSEPNVKIKVVMPDGTERDGMAEPGIEKLKVDDMIQMQRIGFARVYKVGREITLYFAHK